MSQFFINLDLEALVRFDMAKFMEFVVDNHDPLTSRFFRDLRDLEIEGFFVVQGEGTRPDTISFKIYGDHQYWWVIMLYNDLFEVEDIVSGTSLKFPSLSGIEDLFFSLKSLESATV